MTQRDSPPVWIEQLLRSLLPLRDRETVSGDLLEEFIEQKAPQLGSVRARLWYLGQALSFAPHRLRSVFMQRHVLALLCGFTGLCGLWLGAMDLRLRHPGYAGQTVIAAAILLQAVLTLAALRSKHPVLRYLSLCGCVSLFYLAGKALLGLLRGSGMEGYILVIAVALVCQALLTLRTLPRSVEKPTGIA